MTAPGSDHPADLLSPLLDGALSGEERERVERHLEACAACRDHLASLRAMAAAVAAETAPPVPAGLAGRIAAAAAAAKVIPLRRKLAVPISVAATVAAVGLLVVFLWHEGAPPALPPPAAVGTEAVPVPPAANEMRRDAAKAKAETPRETPKSLGYVGAPKARPTKAAAPPPPVRDRTGAPGASPARAADRSYRDDGGNAPAGTAAAPPPAPAAAAGGPARVSMQTTAVSALPCPGPAQDAGRLATWEVGDMQIALRELASIAADAGGRGDGAPVQSGQPYEISVPRDRFVPLLEALGARGVANLPREAPAANEARCLRLRISIRVVLGAP